MSSIVFVDTEVNPQNERLLDIGAAKPDPHSTCHTSSADTFMQFISGARFICGHNIIEHDSKYIRDLLPSDNSISIIDTLCLSPLLFPTRPYHALLKDDKLQTDELNNPLNDAIKAMDLFFDEVNAFERLNDSLKCIYYSLLNTQKRFSGFFQYMEYSPPPYLNESPCPAIQTVFADKICANAPLNDIINNYPIELAYCLALISADDRYSTTPPWVFRSFPAIDNVVKLLRNNPCKDGCPYCNRSLDVHAGLKKYFDYDEFRTYNGEPLQERATEAAVKNRSLLVIFPTAGGKSLTFQLPALIAGESVKGLTVVISPLQSLMKDQVDNLVSRGIADAVTINGLLSQIERSEALARVESGLASILYMSPESLRSKTIERLLLSRNVVRFVIDEAHCFSSWGQDFRVDYLYIGDFIQELQKKKRLAHSIPVSCFTATAKQKVISDIKEYFKQKLNIELEMYSTNAERSNLRYEVLYKETDNDKYEALRNLIEWKNCPTIVYVSRRKRTIEISQRLAGDGFSARPFNGDMDSLDKIANQEAFLSGEAQIIVATSAFGMGVDKSDVGLVVHFDISDSLENYIQEAGRAGRDQSLQADCYVLFHDGDLDKHFILLNQMKLSISEIQQVWRAIKDLTRKRSTISRSPLEIARLAGWDEDIEDIETRVKTAVSALETAGYIKRGKNVPRIYATSISVRSMIEASEAIYASSRFNESQKQTASRIMSFLMSSRSHAKAGRDEAESRVDYIADHLGLPMREVLESVNLMREDGLLADSSDMSAFIYGDKENNKSLDILQSHSILEQFLHSLIGEEGVRINLKKVNGEAEAAGVIGSSVKAIKSILYFWTIRGYIKKSLSMADGNIDIIPQLNAAAFLNKIQKCASLTEFIAQYLFQNNMADELRGKDEIRVPFSVIELKTAFETGGGLFQESGAVTVPDVEDALLYMSIIRALTLEGGFLVLYNAMEIQRLKMNPRIKYKAEDYERLNEFYKQRIQQIHIVGEYANMMVRDYNEALQFVNDYFQMDYKMFISKYFKEKRSKEIKLSITPQKYEQIFGSLSYTQEEIINDDSSQYIVVAAGPGSGKTRVLVHKLASLLLLEDIKHDQLLMLTFSRAAATEFKKQLHQLIGNAAYYIDVMTFHSYCFGLLGKVGSLDDSDKVVKKAVELIRSGEAEPGPVTRKIVVIDEAQDMSEDEYDLLKALMERNDDMRIIAVGDDDQNIYEFRGSNSKHLKSLVTNHGAKVYELLENFRSKRNIVELANAFVSTIGHRLKNGPLCSFQQENGVVAIIKHKSRNLEIPVVKNIIASNKGIGSVAGSMDGSASVNTGGSASGSARGNTGGSVSGSVCILTKTNDEALLMMGLLTKNWLKARLIHSNDGFNLRDLAEFRFFMKLINKESKSPIISDEEWASSIDQLRVAYAQSECLGACLDMLGEFEAASGKRYKTDLEQFIRESKLEEFQRFNCDEIIVSTIHKAKGREFDSVYLVLNDFYCDSDEKKRLLYVGMTRAKKELYIYYNNSCFDGISAKCVERRFDAQMYPPPDILSVQLSHKDVNLGFFKYRTNTIAKLYSGCKLIVNDNGLSVETSAGLKEVLRFSKSFLGRIDELRRKGYDPDNAIIRFIVNWRDKEKGSEHDVILPDINFIRRIDMQKGIRIQKLTKHMPADLKTHTAAVAVLAAEIWREHYTPIIGSEQVEYMLSNFQSAEQIFEDIKRNSYTYFTVKELKTDRMIGYCAVVPKEDYLLLSKLYVHAAFRGKGIARCMLDEVIAVCTQEYGFDKIRLTVNKYNENSIAVYKKFGFVIIDSVETDIGSGFIMDDYVMELAL